MYEATI